MKRGAKHRGFGAASMTEILINGNFLCRNLTGIERFAWEICKRIDSLLSSSDRVSILVPANAPKVPSYARIAVIRSDKEARFLFGIWAFLQKHAADEMPARFRFQTPHL